MPKKLHADSSAGFGGRLAELRKAAGVTQTALAAEIGISQRMMAYYEGPSAQPPANLLLLIARALGVSIDALLGVEASPRRAKATDTRLQRRLAQIEKLSVQERRQILRVLDALIERGQLKQKAQANAVKPLKITGKIMTTLELKLTLPQQLAKQAKAAGLLTPEAITSMLREQLRRQAGKALQGMMDKLADANYPPMSEDEIQAEVNAVRRARRARKARTA